MALLCIFLLLKIPRNRNSRFFGRLRQWLCYAQGRSNQCTVFWLVLLVYLQMAPSKVDKFVNISLI